MDIFRKGVDGIGGTHLMGQRQLFVVNVGSNDGSATLGGTYDGSHAHHAAADDHHHVDVGHLGAAHGVEAHAHRLYQGAGTR